MKTETWDLTELPKGRKTIRGKCVFRVKNKLMKRSTNTMEDLLQKVFFKLKVFHKTFTHVVKFPP